MAANNYDSLLRYYYKLIGHKPRIRVLPYFRHLRMYLRCPSCGGDARVLGEFLTCDKENRAWRLQDLLYPVIDENAASSSVPASDSSRRKDSPNMTPPEAHALQAHSGGVNSFVNRLI